MRCVPPLGRGQIAAEEVDVGPVQEDAVAFLTRDLFQEVQALQIADEGVLK
jgi:hypothetical protein